MNILGIDIGTTTITALLLNEESGKVVRKATLRNNSFVPSDLPFARLQNPEMIIDTVISAVEQITDGTNISAIGVTGQMHGILYLDETNTAVSPLITWQDLRGNELYENGYTYAEFLTKTTDFKAATGFGLTTHFFNTKNHLVPKKAKKICTIHDYLVSILTDENPITHSSDAASLGFYDLKHHKFDNVQLLEVGIDPDILPQVIKNTKIVGKTNCDFLPPDIPVAVAIGDNQASFIGSMLNPENTILVNVGTGSQISFITNSLKSTESGEVRPLSDDEYIFVCSSLCGGRSYQILKNFFVSCNELLGGTEDDLYSKMDLLSEEIYNIKDPLKINCEFSGTRANPEKRGSIENISPENFTPTHMICGVLTGVADELKLLYEDSKSHLPFNPRSLVGSGNGLRKSAVWRSIFKKEFNLDISLPKHSEEAAVGACIFASVANGKYRNIRDAQKILLGE
ncbi:MAG: hypothetical protein IKC01_00580 [Clostridia bacterium]|nr:hypothetical protein [Clostridia bacterium]